MKNKYITMVLAACIFLSGCTAVNTPSSSVNSDETTLESTSEESSAEESTEDTTTAEESSAATETEETSDASASSGSSEPSETSETSVDLEGQYMSVYASTISDIKEFMESGDDYQDKLPIGLNEIRNLDDVQVGYKIMDINSDDIPELLVGNGSTVVAMYSIINGSPKLIIDGTSRNSYGITDSGKIINYGSGGAIYTVFGTYVFDPVTGEIKCEDYYFSYEIEDGKYDKIGYYHNTNGEQDKSKSELLNMNEKAFYEFMDEYTAKAIAVDYIPFNNSSRELKLSEIKKIPEGTDYFEAEPQEKAGVTNVLLESEKTLTDIRVLKLLDVRSTDSEILSFDARAVYKKEKIDSENPLVIKMSFYDTIPYWGISYKDENGNSHTYAFNMSGKDGSMYLSDINVVEKEMEETTAVSSAD